MDSKIAKAIALGIGMIIFVLIGWYAMDVILLAFASMLFAILLNALGEGTRKLTGLPYPLALTLGVIVFIGVLTLTFWLYSPLIAEQAKLLMEQMPQAMTNLRNDLTSFFGTDFFSLDKLQKEFTLTNEKIFNHLLTLFSVTLGSLVSILLFLILGFYLASNPTRYVLWILFMLSPKKKERALEILEKIGQSLRWWLLGKLFSMAVIGILTFIGLWALDVSLAFILGLLAALLAFIPYVGAILAAIPAVLIAFTHSSTQALYVIILFCVIHVIEGYFITPFIEQKTVSIPPAFTILGQVLLLMLLGAFGLALATPLMVVAIAILHYSQHHSRKQLT